MNIFLYKIENYQKSNKAISCTIVLDAGHGGRDGGKVGVSGTIEAELNLKVTFKLGEYLKNLGYNIVYTRCDGNGLYSSASSSNFKQEDMAKRQEIINNANANLVISIHMNSFTDSSVCGAQVFYKDDNMECENLAQSIQGQINTQLNMNKIYKTGDYYLLNNASVPTVIVECGYLSNKAEETKLTTDTYQAKVAYAIFCGIFKYMTSGTNY